MVSRFLVYGLIDPRTGQLRYVGKSESGLSRPRKHTQSWCLRSKKRSKLQSWLKSLGSEGLKCDIEVLEESADRPTNTENEQHWIAYFDMLGANLLNMTAGGEGWHGAKHSDEWRANRTQCKPPIVDKAIELYQTGLSIRAVAKTFGLDSKTLRTHMAKRAFGLRRNTPVKITEEMLSAVQLLVEQGTSWMTAAKLFPHIHPTSFLYRLRRRGVVI